MPDLLSRVLLSYSMRPSWLTFNEIPVLTTWVGGSLIILGALVNVFGGGKQR